MTITQIEALMKQQNNCFALAVGMFIATCLSGPVGAAGPIPSGSYAISNEVCKLGNDDTSSLADFRQRFGSAAILDIADSELTFAAIPAYCTIASAKNSEPNKLQVQAECNVSGNTEDVVFSVETNLKKLSLSVLKGPKDGWFSPSFKAEYVQCEK